MLEPGKACLCCFAQLNEPKGVCPHCGCDNAQIKNEPHQLECGSILAGTYLIGKVLGQGGFGITYVAWDLNLNVKVAIKEYYPEGFVSRNMSTRTSVLTYTGEKESVFQKGKERFVSEAKTLARLGGDKGIVNVRSFFLENGTAYIVMDFAEGETLKGYVAQRGGKLTAQEALKLFEPLLPTLEHIHGAELLHRDISPDNIIMRPDGSLVMLDFGASRQMSVVGEHSNTVNVKHGYAPEEQYRTRGEQGPWTDIYALSATIYRLTTGVTPPQALDRMADETLLIPPTQLGADLTPAQETALLHALAVRAADRTQSIAAFREELYPPAAQKPAQKESRTRKKQPAAKPPVKPAKIEQDSFVERSKPKSRIKWAASALTAIALIVAMVLVSLKIVLPSMKYDNAVSLMDNGRYEDATAILSEMGDYKDSETLVSECAYRQATDLIEDGMLPEAVEILDKLDYKDSAVLAMECTDFESAKVLMQEGKLEEAVALFASIEEFYDSTDLMNECRYRQAIEWEESGNLAEAMPVYIALGEYKDSAQIVQMYYDGAVTRMENGEYLHAADMLSVLGDYQDSLSLIENYPQRWRERTALKKQTIADAFTIFGLRVDGTIAATHNWSDAEYTSWKNIISICAGDTLIGLKSDGTVETNNTFAYKKLDLSDWRDIIEVASGWAFVVGLKSDGTVLAMGENDYGQCNVNDWRDVVAIFASGDQTVGLKKDGTVVASGNNEYGQCNVVDWKNIVDIDIGYKRIIGLKADGTVVSAGINEYGECDISNWTGIIDIANGTNHTIGLKRDGTVVAVGDNTSSQCDVSSWKNIVSITGGGDHTVGLISDGTVVAVGANNYGQCVVDEWSDVVSVFAGYWYTIGVRKNGTAVIAGTNALDYYSRKPVEIDIGLLNLLAY